MKRAENRRGFLEDTGAGIDLSVLPKLFEKFVTKSEKGTGIGLCISKKIVEAHSGTIVGYNNSEDPGATFESTHPLTQEEKYKQEDQQSSAIGT